MFIQDLLSQPTPSFSFEFFPPRTESAVTDLYQTIQDLAEEEPSFVSVTYGAGGTTRELTHELVVRIKEETSIPPIPHLTCVGHGRDEIEGILTRYAEAGVRTILALRGDPPRGVTNYDHSQDDLKNAADLVTEIKTFSERSGHQFGIGVAGFPEGHPATPNRLKELDHLKAKVDAGADYICTQLFFDNHQFHDFRERCVLNGITIPIVAGIMPITSRKGMLRMAELSGGTNFPASLIKQLNESSSEDNVAEAGIPFAIEQCKDLINHDIAGIHFYTLNKSGATREILRNLR